MKILQILPELNLGGVEKGTIELAKYLALNGHFSVVISNGGALDKELQGLGIKHYKLPVHKKSLLTIFTVPKILKILKKEQIDIVHARSRVPAVVGFLAFRKYAKCINISQFLNSTPSFITTAHGYYRRHLVSKIMAKGKLIICPSRIIAKHMVDDFNVSLDRIRLIPRGVDLSKYEFILPSNKDWKHPVFAIIARLTPIKGHIDFIKAFREVLMVSPFAKAWIIGEPSPGKEGYLKELQVLIKRFGLENTVDFLGVRYDIPELLKKIHVLVQPSRMPESFGRVVIEAQASGVPVVASDLGGYKEIIENNKTGYLISAQDVKSISKAMIKIVKNSDSYDQMAIAAREKVERLYSLDNVHQSVLSVYQESLAMLTILIIKFAALGDAILSIPGIRALRSKFPHAKICLLTTYATADIFKNCPYIDKLLIYPSSYFKYIGLLRCLKNIRKISPDISIDLQNNKLSRLVAYFAGIYQRYGFNNGKFSFLLNKRQSLPKGPLLPVEHQAALLSKLGIRDLDKRLELWIEESSQKRIDEFLESHWLSRTQLLVAVNIGASGRWSSKRWATGKIIALVDKLGAYNLRCVLTGIKSDKDLADFIVKNCKNKPINAVGKTDISLLAALIHRCDILVTSDSAPLHIAAAVRTPVLALFGPTDPGRHLPTGEDVYFIRKDTACRPCYKTDCHKNNNCMAMITVEDVFSKILDILGIKKDEDINIEQPL
ncbi:MAG: GT4 family glycosyltransferase PelF [Candidatus Omnitrophica bacterium]|nr:GT4 family glycosyltransferase PelF [Candidatus Omnitrophota bacterium]